MKSRKKPKKNDDDHDDHDDHDEQPPQPPPPPQQQKEEEALLLRALRSAQNNDGGKNGVLVLGPSGSGKTGLVRRCIAQLGSSMDYGNALTVRSRAYFADMDPQESGYTGVSSVRDFFSGAQPSAPSILVVDDLDALVNDMNQGLDGLLKLLSAPSSSSSGTFSSSSSKTTTLTSKTARKKSASAAAAAAKKDGGIGGIGGVATAPRRRVCVCIASSRHKSDKRLLDVYRRCIEVRVGLPRHWDAGRGAAPCPPAAVERTLYPLVRDLLTRPMCCSSASSSAFSGLSEPDKVTVGLLVHENVHAFRAPHVTDATLAAIAHDHASADAFGTLPHQAQTWHLWELCFLLRTYRTNLRLFPSSGTGTTTPRTTTAAATATPSFTKLLTRCSTEVGTRAFLTDMCFRLGCAWHELLPKLALLDAEYTDLVSRGAPQGFLACLRQCHGGSSTDAAAATSSSSSKKQKTLLLGTSSSTTMRSTTSTIARMEWLRMRLVAQLVPHHQGSMYRPELSMAEVRRMYRCLRGESASSTSSSSSSSGGLKKKRDVGDDDENCQETPPLQEDEEEEADVVEEEEEEEDDD